MFTVSTSFDDDKFSCIAFFCVYAWRRWTLIEVRMCSHYLPWNWDLPKTTIVDDFFFMWKKDLTPHRPQTAALNHTWNTINLLSLSLTLMFCAARVFLFMFINAFKPLRAAQFVSHRSIFSIMQSSLFYWLSFFISQSDIA